MQACVLEALARWNDDRGQEALASSSPSMRCYDTRLMHALNSLSEKLIGKPAVANIVLPGKYTGKLAIDTEWQYS